MSPENLPEKLAEEALGQTGQAPVSHDSKALGPGGRVTLKYAIGLARTGVTRDYVARALLARGLDPETTREIVKEAFRVSERQGSRMRVSAMAGGICLIVAGIALCVGVGRVSSGELWSPLGVALVTFGIATFALGYWRT